MTFERQKKFLFISSKFQTPTDKVIKVSAETEGAQYLGGGGRGWGSVGSYLLFTKFLPHQPRPVCQLPGWGDLCQSLPNSLRNSYRRPTLTCVCQPPLSFSNVPLHSPNLLYLYFPVYLYLHLYLYICGSPPLSFSNVPPPMCFQLIWGWTSPCHLRALLCQILGLPPMTMISWKWCKQTHWCYESVSEIGVFR